MAEERHHCAAEDRSAGFARLFAVSAWCWWLVALYRPAGSVPSGDVA